MNNSVLRITASSINDIKCLPNPNSSDLQLLISGPEFTCYSLETPETTVKRSCQPNWVDKDDKSLLNTIEGKYTVDYNIIRIHEIILNKLHMEQVDGIKKHADQLKSLNEKISSPQSYIDRITTLNEIENINKEIDLIKHGRKIDIYKQKVNHLLDEYKQLGSTQSKIVFGMDVKSQTMTKDTIERLRIIDDFFNIAKDYIRINVIREIDNNNNCEGCGYDMNNVNVDDDNYQRCPKCGVEKYVVSITPNVKEIQRVNTSLRNEYCADDNFIKTLRRYQGLQQIKFPPHIFQDLDRYFLSKGRPNSEEIKKLPLNERGRRGDTDHKMLFDALGNLGYTDYYEDSNLIGHYYWGWKLPDVRHLEHAIMSDYKKTQKVYISLPDRERSSSLGTQFRLFKQLELRGHECYRDEFKIADNPNSLEFHYRTWKQMCEGANDPEIYFIAN